MQKQKKVLIIEDDPNIIDLVEIHINDLGFDLERAEDGSTGVEMALTGEYSIVILDLMLPQLNGLEVCKKIRNENKYLPILMLTAKSEELDKVLGLELGADDYLTKPFSIHELIARIKAILRRLEVNQENKIDTASKMELKIDRLFIDFQKRKVTLSGKPVDLTVKEFDLLALFAKNPGRAYNRQELLDLVWGYQFVGYEHTVNSHINRLRNKIENDPANPFFIRTVWGIGYRFVEPGEEDQ